MPALVLVEHARSARKAWNIVMSTAAPSTMAASIDLALAAALGLEQGADHAEGEEHAAAAEVADHVERRHRRLAGPAEVGQRAGQRDVVDVVARTTRRTGPSWPQPVMRPNTSFGLRARQTSGPTPRRSITPGRKPSMRASADSTSSSSASTPSGFLRSMAIERRPRLQHVAATASSGSRLADVLGPVDADDVGAHVGQHHGAERARGRCRRPR